MMLLLMMLLLSHFFRVVSTHTIFFRYDWNPLTACQCLQQCKYDSIEAFDMTSSCAYEDIEIRTASLFPDLLMIPGTDTDVVRESEILA